MLVSSVLYPKQQAFTGYKKDEIVFSVGKIKLKIARDHLLRFSSKTVDFRASRYYEMYYDWLEHDITSAYFGVPLKTAALGRKQLIKTACWVSLLLLLTF